MIAVTNGLIKQTHIRHEKNSENRKGNQEERQNELNHATSSYQDSQGLPSHKFDEMLSILASLFDHLKAQAPTSETYDALTLQMNKSFQKVFARFSELQESILLAPVAESSTARGGEGPSRRNQSILWKLVSEFRLRDEDYDDSLQVLTGSPNDGDDDDDDDQYKYITNAIVGIPAPRKFPAKVLSEEEQRI